MDPTTCRFHWFFIVAVTDHLQCPFISSDFGRESPAIAPGPPATDLMTNNIHVCFFVFVVADHLQCHFISSLGKNPQRFRNGFYDITFIFMFLL